jgi:predicted naringenin-chalcone synthase
VTPVAPSRRASIRAIGTAVPETRLSQDAIHDLMTRFHVPDAARTRWLRALYRGSRVEARHTALGSLEDPVDPVARHLRDRAAREAPTTSERMATYAREAPRLAERACRDALARPGAPAPAEIDHLFVVSCTGFLAPGLDVLLARALGMREDVGRSLIGFQGCQGGLSALRLADLACRAEPASTSLVACVELCTLHFQSEGTEDDMLGAALFADGAAAVVVSGPEARAATAPRLEIARAETFLHPDSLDEMTWTVGDEGFVMHLSSLIPRILGLDVRRIVEERLGLGSREERGRRFWAVHPGGAGILDAIERSLELPEAVLETSRRVLARFGNMSSPTVFFVLRDALEDGAVAGPGVALAFGPGLTVEAALLEKR